MESCVARQPIFDRQGKLFAYELLFRDLHTSSPLDANGTLDGDRATSTILDHSYFAVGMEKIANGKKAFINFTQKLLEDEVPLLFPAEGTVVEILEDVQLTAKIIAVCRELAQQGYTIALDDFVYREELEPLIEPSHIIKVDFLATQAADIAMLAERFGGHKLLLAEKVETKSQYAIAQGLGFDYFQGYLLSHPEMMTGKAIPHLNATLLDMLSEINRNDFDYNRLEEILKRDVSMSYRLFRYINIYLYKSDLSSLQQVMTLLGQKELRNFISLMLMSSMASGIPDQLIRNSCVRARFCEAVGNTSGQNALSSSLFTVGLFSNLHRILGKSMEQALEQMPFCEDIRSALIDRSGNLGRYLQLAVDYESANWADVSHLGGQMDLNGRQLTHLYAASCQWANRVVP